MKKLYQIGLLAVLCSTIISCKGQKTQADKNGTKVQSVGGAFENSEFTYYAIPKTIGSIDTSAGWKLNGQKILLTGIVYQIDAKTPAPNVLLYYYQTNSEGRYLHKAEEKRSMPPNELGQTHGYIRGWVKTDKEGKYYIYTIRPGTYPTNDEPAHVHITVKEPNDIKEYYIDDFVFDDDKLLNSARRKKLENRSGSGVLRLVKKDELLIGERNIILGLNIPEYPEKTTGINSGKNIGEDILSFIPYHAWGPDKGTKTCPICKYGWYHGILYFVGNNPNWDEIKKWLAFLEMESEKREKYLKVYFVYGNEKGYSKIDRDTELARLGNELKLEKVALTFVPAFSDSQSEIDLNRINQEVENTIVVYKRSRIVDKFINLKPTQNNFNLIKERLDQTINEYFTLPKSGQD
ncbi:MAG: intradiol ring-cleavage dioxygenase [Chitinophagaceae bacterium]|nr:MAG: intradiol ring-cleavage dioxygenase [Chitinophagaceae bacterium]